MKTPARVLFSILVVTVFLPGQASTGIQGVWRLIEVTSSGLNASTNSAPQPALYIFTSRHYSITRVTSTEPRPGYKDLANRTEAETLAAWGPFQAQAGTYEVKGNILFLRVTVSKQPQLMNPALQPEAFTMSLEENTLTVVQKSDQAGRPIANPQTFRLARVE
jgi:hypothetical protein